jgi:hypothetical protein
VKSQKELDAHNEIERQRILSNLVGRNQWLITTYNIYPKR